MIILSFKNLNTTLVLTLRIKNLLNRRPQVQLLSSLILIEIAVHLSRLIFQESDRLIILLISRTDLNHMRLHAASFINFLCNNIDQALIT